MKKFLKSSFVAIILVLSLLVMMIPSVAAAEEVTKENAVASVTNASGTQYFASLNDAIISAKNGETVLVHKDMTLDTITMTGRTLTIKGDGAVKPVITAANSKSVIKILENSDVTFENLAFTNYANVIMYGTSGTDTDTYKITLKNVEASFKASGAIYGYAALEVDITVIDSKFTAGASGNAILNTSIAVVNGCNFTLDGVTMNELCRDVNAGAKGVINKNKNTEVGENVSGDAAAVAKGAVARVGETQSGNIGVVYFTTLTDAVNAAKDGQTVYVFADVNSFDGATFSGKTIKVVGVDKFTVKPSSAKYAFTLLNSANITLENLNFAGYSGKNLILFGQDNEATDKYIITLKNVDVGFNASGAIYGYQVADVNLVIDSCSFVAEADGKAILNFTNATCYEKATMTLTDTKLNANCAVLSTTGAADATKVTESFTSDAKAIAANVRVRIGAAEGGKVGEVYFRVVDADTLKNLASGTKITVLCSCGAKTETASVNCSSKVKCSSCGKEHSNLAVHSYSEATCTKKATCSGCGAETGDLVAHKFSTATCTKKATCSVCNEETGDLAAHKFSSATCQKKATCYKCGIEEGDLGEHRDGDTNGKCDLCEADLSGETTASAETNGSNVTDKPDTSDKDKKGCNGTVAGVGLALIAAVGTCAVFVEKKRR